MNIREPGTRFVFSTKNGDYMKCTGMWLVSIPVEYIITLCFAWDLPIGILSGRARSLLAVTFLAVTGRFFALSELSFQALVPWALSDF